MAKRARKLLWKPRAVATGATLAMLTSLVVPSFADTAGTGVCQQTFTPSGNGTASVVVVESSGFCYVAFKNTGNSGTQSTFSLSLIHI